MVRGKSHPPFIFLEDLQMGAVNPLNINPSKYRGCKADQYLQGAQCQNMERDLSSPRRWEPWASNIPLLLKLETDSSFHLLTDPPKTFEESLFFSSLSRSHVFFWEESLVSCCQLGAGLCEGDEHGALAPSTGGPKICKWKESRFPSGPFSTSWLKSCSCLNKTLTQVCATRTQDGRIEDYLIKD